jgi:hypothetical protein
MCATRCMTSMRSLRRWRLRPAGRDHCRPDAIGDPVATSAVGKQDRPRRPSSIRLMPSPPLPGRVGSAADPRHV